MAQHFSRRGSIGQQSGQITGTMYCRSCGSQVSEDAQVCVKCGAHPLSAAAFCQNCGFETRSGEKTCTRCGVKLGHIIRTKGIVRPAASGAVSNRSRTAAFLLCFFFGFWGVHRFYAGRIGTGILQLLTFGGLTVWWMIDIIITLSGNLKDGEGRYIRKW